VSVERIRMSDLGDSPQTVARTLLEDFAARGWKSASTDAATRIIRALESAPLGVTASKLARAAGREFLSRNGVSERSLTAALTRLAERSRI
jgi:hypothetical protein